MTNPLDANRKQEVQVPASREHEVKHAESVCSESQNMLMRRRAPDATVPRVPSEHQAFRFRY